MKRWGLDDAKLIADTFTSKVFRARRGAETVIVKCIKPEGHEELNGIDYLRWRAGKGAVAVYDTHDGAVLMQDAGGVTLRAVHEREGEAAANRILERVLPGLLAPLDAEFPQTLPTLNEKLDSLFSFAVRNDLAELSEGIGLAAALVPELLASQRDIRPLHGDIHHENIISRNGNDWLAIDPKGILGDPHYDVANLFGNPIGDAATVLDPVRVSRLADMLTAALGLERKRILQFALVHAAVSVAWSFEDAAPETRPDVRERAALIPLIQGLLLA